VKNKVLEMTDLLRYLPIFELFFWRESITVRLPLNLLQILNIHSFKGCQHQNTKIEQPTVIIGPAWSDCSDNYSIRPEASITFTSRMLLKGKIKIPFPEVQMRFCKDAENTLIKTVKPRYCLVKLIR
jgi:hypothetical protein